MEAETILDRSFKIFGDEEFTCLGRVLQQNTSILTELRLDNILFGEKGMTALGVGLEHNTTVTKIDLSHNAIGAFGATVLGSVLQSNATLTELNLDCNGIGNEGATALAIAACNTTRPYSIWTFLATTLGIKVRLLLVSPCNTTLRWQL